MGYWGYGVPVMWDVQDVGCLGSGMLGCRMFGLWDVETVVRLGCGMFGL